MKNRISKIISGITLSLVIISSGTLVAFAALSQQDVDGGVWTYGTRDGDCISIYFHGTQKHFANVFNANGETSGRVYADANANAEARIRDIGTCRAYYGLE